MIIYLFLALRFRLILIVHFPLYIPIMCFKFLVAQEGRTCVDMTVTVLRERGGTLRQERDGRCCPHSSRLNQSMSYYMCHCVTKTNHSLFTARQFFCIKFMFGSANLIRNLANASFISFIFSCCQWSLHARNKRLNPKHNYSISQTSQLHVQGYMTSDAIPREKKQTLCVQS